MAVGGTVLQDQGAGPTGGCRWQVEFDGQSVKPGRILKVGDLIIGNREMERFEITVQKVTAQRLSASLASGMFNEEPTSIKRRAHEAAQRKLAHADGLGHSVRPDKRQRRKIIDFIRGRK